MPLNMHRPRGGSKLGCLRNREEVSVARGHEKRRAESGGSGIGDRQRSEDGPPSGPHSGVLILLEEQCGATDDLGTCDTPCHSGG